MHRSYWFFHSFWALLSVPQSRNETTAATMASIQPNRYRVTVSGASTAVHSASNANVYNIETLKAFIYEIKTHYNICIRSILSHHTPQTIWKLTHSHRGLKLLFLFSHTFCPLCVCMCMCAFTLLFADGAVVVAAVAITAAAAAAAAAFALLWRYFVFNAVHIVVVYLPFFVAELSSLLLKMHINSNDREAFVCSCRCSYTCCRFGCVCVLYVGAV